MLGWLRLRNRWTDSALSLYGESVAASRQRVFYETFRVPDTLDGRFDMLLLHAALLVRRLNREGREGQALAQEYFDRMFTEMDRTVREIGVGDLSVRRHVRAMMRAFYGRAEVYGEALDGKDPDSLKKALMRNLYAMGDGRGVDEMVLDAMCRYVILCEDALGWQDGAALLLGRAGFPPVPVVKGEGADAGDWRRQDGEAKDETQKSRAD